MIQAILTRLCIKKSSSGQAMIEFIAVILVFLILIFFSYNAGLMYHNYTVISQAVKSAGWAAAYGAPDSVLQEIIYDAGGRLLKSSMVDYNVDVDKGLIYEIWINDQSYAPSQSALALPPNAQYRAEYVFRAKNYNARVGVIFKLGFYVPFIDTFYFDVPITTSVTILENNDMDHDGLVDIYEPELYNDPVNFRHYSHLDYNRGTGLPTSPYTADDSVDANNDIDGDGSTDDVDTGVYDYDNDGIEDFKDPGDNLLRNPLVGGGPDRPF